MDPCLCQIIGKINALSIEWGESYCTWLLRGLLEVSPEWGEALVAGESVAEWSQSKDEMKVSRTMDRHGKFHLLG